MVKNPPANVGDSRDMGLIPGSGRLPGTGNDNPLQYSCLENPMDRGAWWAAVHGVEKESDTVKQLSMHIHSNIHIYIMYIYIYLCINSLGNHLLSVYHVTGHELDVGTP